MVRENIKLWFSAEKVCSGLRYPLKNRKLSGVGLYQLAHFAAGLITCVNQDMNSVLQFKALETTKNLVQKSTKKTLVERDSPG